jgi:hypothetical protein
MTISNCPLICKFMTGFNNQPEMFVFHLFVEVMHELCIVSPLHPEMHICPISEQ